MARLLRILCCLGAIAGLVGPGPLFPAATGAAWAQAGPYAEPLLLAFLGCNTAVTNCQDFRNHLVYLAQSADGSSWSVPPGYVPVSGSVPDVVRRGSTIYVYFPGQLRRFRIDTGVWEAPGTVSLTDAECVSFVDPSPTVDETGRIVLFYLCAGAPGTGDPAQCPPGQTSCVKRFRSATEVDGSDGAQFVADPGDRLQVTLRSTPDSASDPDLFFDGTRYVLYISRGNSTEVYTSPSLRGAYTGSTTLPQGRLTNNAGGVPSGHYDALRAQYHTFVHRPETDQKIYEAVHPTLDSPLASADFVAVVTGSSLGLGAAFSVASPGFAENANGPGVLAGSPAGSVATPAEVTFQWRDLTRSPAYALEFCVAATGQTCFSSQAGTTRFDSPAQTFWLVDGSDPAMRPVIGRSLGAGGVLAYTRTGPTVTLSQFPIGHLDLSVQYRIFPIVINDSRSGTLNAPDSIHGLVDLPPGGTSSLPVSVSLH